MTGADFGQLIGPVARKLLGEPNVRLSSKTELRFGTNGSKAVDLENGRWYDHEAQAGGNVLELIAHCKAAANANGGALEWMRRAGILPNNRKIVAQYDYVNESGDLLFQVVRFDPKDFRQRRPDKTAPDGWSWSVKGVRRVPYRLIELIEATALQRPVLIVEGEKDVDKLKALSVAATCNAGGAGKWHTELNEHLRGADVVIVSDNDDAGRAHTEAVALALAGIAARIRVLDLAHHWPACPAKGDISDWLSAGNSVEMLWRLVEALPDWSPGPMKSPEGTFDPPTYVAPDPKTIPRRQWLLGRHYLRGAVSATVGAPGRLKSSTVLVEIIGMACGRDLLAGTALPSGPLHAAYMNGEENQDELDRRAAAICQRYGIDPQSYAGRLWVMSTRDHPIRVAVPTPKGTGAMVNRAVVDGLIAWCDHRALDVVAFDPLISFHSIRENANEDMDVVVKEAFGAVAGTSRAVDLAHHPRKLAAGEVNSTVDDARGGSALLAAWRVARTFNFMTTSEAAQLGIHEDERRKHVRIENGKSNPGPIGKANWLKIEVENLPNGDEVACSTPWKPPNPFDGVSVGDAKVVQGAARSGIYRADSQSPKWLGWWLAENLQHLGIKARSDDRPRDKAAIARLNSILKTWVKNDVLQIEERPDENRERRRYYAACGDHRPATTEADDIGNHDQVTIQ